MAEYITLSYIPNKSHLLPCDSYLHVICTSTAGLYLLELSEVKVEDLIFEMAYKFVLYFHEASTFFLSKETEVTMRFRNLIRVSILNTDRLH